MNSKSLRSVITSSDFWGVCSILNRDAENININMHDGTHGFTPLHIACACGNVQIVEYLCEHGGDINAPDYSGETPLYQAVMNGNSELLSYLLLSSTSATTAGPSEKKHINRNCIDAKRLLAYTDKRENRIALQFFILAVDYDIMKNYLANNLIAMRNIMRGFGNGRTGVLHQAVEAGFFEAASYCLANVPVDITDARIQSFHPDRCYSMVAIHSHTHGKIRARPLPSQHNMGISTSSSTSSPRTQTTSSRMSLAASRCTTHAGWCAATSWRR